uniref:C2H2-type domain-containing protein n=1 Tax=Seriola dumerili TaxID=41447 RepID=A0A3B4V1M8_SERDU
MNSLVRRLRSRGEKQPLTQDGSTESDSKVDPKRTEMTPPESSHASNLLGVKRRRPKLADHQVPSKLSRLDDSQETLSVLSNDTGCVEGAETDKQVELNADKQETDTDGKEGHCSPQSAVGQEQQTELKEGALPQRKVCSQAAAEPEVTPSEDLNSLNLAGPTQSDETKTKQSLFGVLSEFNTHRNQCRGERTTSSSAIKEEETMSLIQYTVPALRCSSGYNSVSPLAAANCEEQKKQTQTSRKKRFANLKKPFQSTVIPAHHLSHLVSKLNKLDNRSDPRKYLCPSCGRLFRHMGRLRAHMLTHAPGQSYTCACCGKTLENWKKLWHHQRVHRQRRGRFTCPQCGQGFRFVEPYKKHMSEPKKVFLPYQCEQCRCNTHKDSAFDLSIDDHSTQSNKKTFSPSTNNHIVILLTLIGHR